MMNARSRSVHTAACMFSAAVLSPGCHKPTYKTQPTAGDGRLEYLMGSPALYETWEPKRPEGSQKLADLNAELRAHHAEQLDALLKRIEQSYLEDKNGRREVKPLRKEQVRTIWDTKPEKVP